MSRRWRWWVTGVVAVLALWEFSVRRPSLASWTETEDAAFETLGGDGSATAAHRARADSAPTGAPGSAAVAGGASFAADASAAPAVSWRTLAGLDLATGIPDSTVGKHEGTVVRIPGYMLPLDDFALTVRTFLLVPWVGACVHTPPPPPNQLVVVNTEGGRDVPVEWWRAVWVIGTLKITPVSSPYGAASYTLADARVVPWTDDEY